MSAQPDHHHWDQRCADEAILRLTEEKILMSRQLRAYEEIVVVYEGFLRVYRALLLGSPSAHPHGASANGKRLHQVAGSLPVGMSEEDPLD